MRFLAAIFKDERAVTAVEYAIILGMIFMALVVGLTGLAESTVGMWNDIAEKVTGE